LGDTIYVGLSAAQDGCVTNIDSVSVIGNVINTVANQLANELKLYPNPIGNSFTIDGMIGTNTIEIYSELGQLISTTKTEFSIITINTENISPGIYLVKVKGNGSEKTIKVSK